MYILSQKQYISKYNNLVNAEQIFLIKNTFITFTEIDQYLITEVARLGQNGFMRDNLTFIKKNGKKYKIIKYEIEKGEHNERKQNRKNL